MVSTLRTWRLALISAFVLGALPSWAQDSTTADNRPEAPLPSSPAQTSALNAELFYELLLGEMSATQGDAANAVPLLLDAARQSQSEQLYQRAAAVALQSRSGQHAWMVANEWFRNFPDSRDANRFSLQVLLMLNRISESQDYLRREVAAASTPSKPATYLAITQLYSRAPDKQMAAHVVEQALQPDLQDTSLAPAAWATIGHLRLAAQQKDLAMQALQHAHQHGPRNGATALLALELMESGIPSAEALAQDYLLAQPAPPIQLAYARILVAQQRSDEAQLQLTAVLQAEPEMIEAWMLQASLHAQQGQSKKAQQDLARLETLAAQIPQEAPRNLALSQIFLLGGRLSLQHQDYAQALKWLDKIPDAASDLTIQSLKAQALAKQGKLALGRALIRAVPASTEGQSMQKRQAEVALLRDNGAPQEAYLLQRTLHEQQPHDADIAYETAILAERAGKLDAMETLLRDIIQRHPDHYHALNALGYSYADRGIRLAEAKALIESALQQAPNDPFIMDSLGWVEFRLGNQAQSLHILEQAYALRNDTEIAAHLGEVLWVSGDTARARSIWRSALQRDADNDTLRATLQRLQVKP